MRLNAVIIGLAICVIGAAAFFVFEQQGRHSPSPVSLAAQAAVRPAGNPVVKAQDFDAWRLECVHASNGHDTCRIFQRVLAKQGSRQVAIAAAAVALVPGQANGAAALIPVLRMITPTGVDLSTGVGANIDKGRQFNIPFRSCGAAACLAAMPVDAGLLQRLNTGTMMAAAFRPEGMARPIVVTLPLKGFPAALQALQKAVVASK